MNDPVEIIFPVEQDEFGYPPITRETIWCIPIDVGLFVVDNIPFYVRDISKEDEIRAGHKGNELWYMSLAKKSPNTTIRAFAQRKKFESLLRPKMESFGGLTERMEGNNLIAVSFPPSADLAGAIDFLDKESGRGNIAFEESSIRYR